MESKENIQLKRIIHNVIHKKMDIIMNKTKDELNEYIKKYELYDLFMPNEISKLKILEKHFLENIGGVFKEISFLVANNKSWLVHKDYEVRNLIRIGRLRRIQETLNKLEHKKGAEKQQPNWEAEIEYINRGRGQLIPVTIICDVFIRNEASGESYAFEVKGPLPNSDQSKVSKEKIFKLFAMDKPQITKAFYALPYNPYGAKADYDWSFPKRWFDMNNSPVVLIGEEFWDFIGGVGTYQLFIEEVNKLGKHYKNRIYTEFLNIEPPTK